ncbi:MAG: amidohydrolase family protein [Myxococcota bacterium]
MRNGFKIFDADAHVVYPRDLWFKYLDKKHVSRIEVRDPAGLAHYNPVLVDGRYTQHATSLYGQFQKAIDWTHDDMIEQYGELITKGFSGERVAAALAREGIDIAVVYGPEYDLWFDGIDPDLQAAMVRAYNRWGQEMRETSGGRVLTSGPIPLGDVKRAVEEIEYAYHVLGIRAFWARPNYLNHRNLGDRYYDPVYELLESLDCAFATHEFMGLTGETEGSNRFRTFTEWHTTVHPHEAMNAMLSMIVHGVFERFPRLRCAYLEAGCGWVPSWLHRIDEQLEMAGAREFPALTMSATEYFKRNCWTTTECEDPFVADVIRWLGDGHIVFESDFPHPDSKYPEATKHFLELMPDEIAVDSKRKILWDNALDFYRLPEAYLPKEFVEVSGSD